VNDRERVLQFIRSIASNSATNSEIQQVFQITRELLSKGVIQGRQFGKDWSFWAHGDLAVSDSPRKERKSKTEAEPDRVASSGITGRLSPTEFELLASRQACC
jgi:hypothetical protein